MNLASGASTLEVMEGAHRYNRWIYDRVRDGLGQRILEIEDDRIGLDDSRLRDHPRIVRRHVQLAPSPHRRNPVAQYDLGRPRA